MSATAGTGRTRAIPGSPGSNLLPPVGLTLGLLAARLAGAPALSDPTGAAFLVAPGVGIRVLGLDVAAKYEAWFRDGTRGFFGLKAGYNF